MKKQTIDGVRRELLEACDRANSPPQWVRDELRALLDAPVEQFNPDGWSIDHTAGRPILMHNNCSVIEAEQAYGLLELIKNQKVVTG